MANKPDYFYEHTNGQIIRKPAAVVDGNGGGPLEYFDSPAVKRWWQGSENMPQDLKDHLAQQARKWAAKEEGFSEIAAGSAHPDPNCMVSRVMGAK